MDINISEGVLKNSNWSLVSEPCTTSEPSDSKGDIDVGAWYKSVHWLCPVMHPTPSLALPLSGQ